MRLTAEQIDAIKAAVAEVFGPGARARLFGSRVDDAKRGGDIDLLVEVPEGRDGFRDRIALAVALERRLGERRVDLVLVAPDTRREPIHDLALSEGVAL